MTLDQLYEEHESLLYGYAMRLTRDAERADDLVQDALVRAMGHLTLLALLARPQRQAWLYRTLRNLFLDEEQRRHRQVELVQEIARESLGNDSESFEEAPVDPLNMCPSVFAMLLKCTIAGE